MGDIRLNPMLERPELLVLIELHDGKAMEWIGAMGPSRRRGTWYTHIACYAGVSLKGNL
jgi:hypothetical protein